MFDGIGIFFLTAYAVIKDTLIFWKPKDKKVAILPFKIIIIVLTLLFLVITFISIAPLVLLRIILGICLRIRYRKLWGGFLSGQDSLFEAYTNKVVFNVIVILSTEDNPLILFEKLKTCARNIHQASYKFSCNIHRFFGYFYYLKDQINFDDDNIMQYSKINNEEYLSRDMLFDHLEQNYTTIKNNRMWGLMFFCQPIKWTEDVNSPKKQYALVVTVRHSLGDGPTVAGILRKYLIVEDSSSPKNIKNIGSAKVALNLNNVFLYRNPLFTKLDKDALKIEGNTDWHYFCFTESSVKYLPLIKKLKNELKVGFSEVLGAAICAGIIDYIIQRKVNLNQFTLAIIVRVMDKELKEIIGGTYNFKELYNNSTVVTINIPVKEQKMKDNILYFHQWGESMKTAVDFFLAYAIIDHIVAYLPAPLVKLFQQTCMEGMTVGFTNMTGFSKSKCSDTDIDDMLSFTPQFLQTGFTFNCLSYDERLQISLSSRKGFVYSRKDLESIVSIILHKLDQAKEEIFII